MPETPLIATYLPDLSPLVLTLLRLCVLSLPVLVAIAALMRLRSPHPSRAAWSCVVAAVLLFLFWLMPPAWLQQLQMRQFRDFAAIGIYGWLLFDWFRLGREDGWGRADLPALGAMTAMIALTGWGILG